MARQLSDTVRQASAQSPNANLAPGQHALFYTPETNPERVDVPLIEKVQSSKHIDRNARQAPSVHGGEG
jgi:hypothetical protein